MTTTVSRSSNAISTAAANSTTSPEAGLAGRVIARIISNSNLTANQAARLVAGVSNITVQSVNNAQEVTSALNSIVAETVAAAAASGIDLDVAETISGAVANTTCTTVSNAGVTCTTS